MGLITEHERYEATVDVWSGATEKVTGAIQEHLSEYGCVFTHGDLGRQG